MFRLVVCVMTPGLFISSCSPALDEDSRGPVRDELAPAAYLAGTSSRLITSSNTGRTYQVSVALPRGYEDSAGMYPVLYSLDANLEFGTVVETARHLRLENLVPELVIVGVGYPVGHFFDAIGKRAFDLTVTEDSEWGEAVFSREPSFPPLEGSGGAPGFLRFLMDELVPLVDMEYRVASEDVPWIGYITNLRDLSAILADRSYDGFEWTVHFFEDEYHTSVVPAAVSRGLRYIYAAN